LAVRAKKEKRAPKKQIEKARKRFFVCEYFVRRRPFLSTTTTTKYNNNNNDNNNNNNTRAHA